MENHKITRGRTLRRALFESERRVRQEWLVLFVRPIGIKPKSFGSEAEHYNHWATVATDVREGFFKRNRSVNRRALRVGEPQVQNPMSRGRPAVLGVYAKQ